MESKPAAGRFRALVEHGADAIWLLGGEGRILYANPASRAVLGYGPEELTGASALDYFLPTDREEVRQRLWDQGGAASSFRMRRKDGRIIWAEVRGANCLADAEIEGVVVSLRDVTESRKAEQLLRDSESRFKAMVESSSDGFVLLDRQGTVVYSGPPVLGYAEQSFIGRSVLEVIHPDDLERVLGHLAAVATATGKCIRDEFRARHADGNWRWLEVSFRNLLANPAVGGIVVNYREVTERRAHEEELRRTRDQMRHILESIREAFLALDREWRFTYVNRLIAEAVGKVPEELIGQNIWEVFPRARETEFYSNYRRVMIERTPAQWEMKYAPTGRWLDVHAYPTEEGLAAYILDITERKRAEQRAAALHEVTVALVAWSRLSEIAPRVLKALRDGLGWAEAKFWKVDEGAGVLRASRVRSAKTLKKGEGAAGEAWATGRVAWKASAQGTAVAFPVRKGEQTVGVMEFATGEERDLEPELAQLMEAVAGQIAQALERGAGE